MKTNAGVLWDTSQPLLKTQEEARERMKAFTLKVIIGQNVWTTYLNPTRINIFSKKRINLKGDQTQPEKMWGWLDLIQTAIKPNRPKWRGHQHWQQHHVPPINEQLWLQTVPVLVILPCVLLFVLVVSPGNSLLLRWLWSLFRAVLVFLNWAKTCGNTAGPHLIWLTLTS